MAQWFSPWIGAIGSGLFSLAAAVFGYALCSAICSARRSDLTYFESQRRQTLREASTTYRLFEPLVDELRPFASALVGPKNDLHSSLELQPEWSDWRSEDLVAVRVLEGTLFAVVAGLLFSLAHPLFGAIAAFGMCCAYCLMSVQGINAAAVRQRQAIKRRLPYAVDLMALVMEAGGTFLDSLEAVFQENRSTPLGQELEMVVSGIRFGRPRADALRSLAERVADSDLEELVYTIIKGEELGTPLAEILRCEADRMRLKRSQWAEKSAAQAQVQIAFPGMLIMIGCLLVIVAPFVMKLIGNL